MKRFTEFYEAFHFLKTHKIVENIGVDGLKNNYFDKCLDISVVKVNPETDAIEINDDLNIKTQVWLEFGPMDGLIPEHDTRLDCGADTFEEAIIQLANLVDKYYLDNGKEKQGATCNDIKVEFTQYIAKNNKDLLLTKTDIYNQYDIHLKTISTIIKLSTGEILPNDLEYDYDWEILIEG